MENLSDGEDINRVWENIKESLGLHKLTQHKPRVDKECLGFLDQRKQAKMQWIHVPSLSNIHNLNIVRHDASRHFRNKKNDYLKAKIEELEITVRKKLLGICIGASMTLRRVTSLELIQ